MNVIYMLWWNEHNCSHNLGLLYNNIIVNVIRQNGRKNNCKDMIIIYRMFFDSYVYIVTYYVNGTFKQIQNISIVCMMEKTPLTHLNVSCELN